MNHAENTNIVSSMEAGDIYAHMQSEAATILEDARLALDTAALKSNGCPKANLIAAAEGLRIGSELSQLALWLESKRETENSFSPKFLNEIIIPECQAVASAEEHRLMVKVVPELPLLRSKTNRLAARAKRLHQLISERPAFPTMAETSNNNDLIAMHSPKEVTQNFTVINGGIN